MGVSGNSWIGKIPFRKFAKVVGMEMVRNKLSNDNEGGKSLFQVPL